MVNSALTQIYGVVLVLKRWIQNFFTFICSLVCLSIRHFIIQILEVDLGSIFLHLVCKTSYERDYTSIIIFLSTLEAFRALGQKHIYYFWSNYGQILYTYPVLWHIFLCCKIGWYPRGHPGPGANRNWNCLKPIITKFSHISSTGYNIYFKVMK